MHRRVVRFYTVPVVEKSRSLIVLSCVLCHTVYRTLMARAALHCAAFLRFSFLSRTPPLCRAASMTIISDFALAVSGGRDLPRKKKIKSACEL